MRRALVLLLVAGCHDRGVAPPILTAPHDGGTTPTSGPAPEGSTDEPDLSVAHDLGQPGAGDMARPGGDLGHGGAPDAGPVAPANATLTGLNVLDVSVDQGGGVWAVTSSTVYYLPPGRATPFTYDQKSGLARGWYSWTDTWFSPGTYPVTFSAVAGATPGQAIVGNIGAIADRLEVDPTTGAVIRIDNMAVTSAQQPDPTELKEQQQRIVATWRAVADLAGTYNGSAYVGGFHGFSVFHGLDGNCGCAPQFEEHRHYITPDGSFIYGDDVRGLSITNMGDVWSGDRDGATFLPQRTLGPGGDFWTSFTAVVDVWPNTRDEISSVAADASGGVWVASSVNGLAYIAPATHAVSHVALPQNQLTSVAVDGKGGVWVGTQSMGVAHLSGGGWSWYHQANGLPSDDIHAVYWDRWSGAGKIWVATDYGIAAIGP
jgi:hypothetical protein